MSWRRRPGWACLGTLTGTWLRLFLRQWRIRSVSIRRWSWWCKDSGMGYAPFASPFPGRGPLGAALPALSPPQDHPPLSLPFPRVTCCWHSNATVLLHAAVLRLRYVPLPRIKAGRVAVRTKGELAECWAAGEYWGDGAPLQHVSRPEISSRNVSAETVTLTGAE